MNQGTVGFIGLGAMGMPMAVNIAKQGQLKSVYNRSAHKTKSLMRQGVMGAASPAALAGEVEFIVIMVTGPDALEEVVFGAAGLLQGVSPGQTVIQMSTVSPESTIKCAQAFAQAQVDFIDAPVSGTVAPAQAGKLVILAGAQAAVLEKARPVLGSLGSRIVHCGEVGAGTKMKLAVNLLLAGMMQGLSEAMVFAQKMGLDVNDLLSSLEGGAMAAPLFSLKGKAITQGQFSKAFPIDLVAKDLSLLLDAAQQSRIQLPQSEVNLKAYQEAQAQGWGDEDIAAVIKPLEKQAQVSVRRS